MFKELWRSGPFGHILADILMALSIMVSAYLLFIAYRKFVAYIGGGKILKTTVKYAVLYDLAQPYAKGKIQFGIEIKEDTDITFQIINKHDKVVKLLAKKKLIEGIYPFDFNTQEEKNGEYFYQLITPYQKITKKFYIVN